VRIASAFEDEKLLGLEQYVESQRACVTFWACGHRSVQEDFRHLTGNPEVHEVAQRRLTERHQREPHVRRVPLAADGEVRLVKVRA